MKKILLVLSLLGLVTLFGCTSAEELTLPDGSKGYNIKCYDSKSKCFDKAREICGGNYKVFESSGTPQGGFIMTIKCEGKAKS